MVQSNAILALKFVAVDMVGAALYFPIWWYTRGTARMAAYCFRTMADKAQDFGISVWLKNIFTPMFGQRDITGRLVSLIMRLVVIFYYSLVLLLLSVVMLALFLAWLALPIFVSYEFFNQLIGLLRSAPV